MFKSKKILAIIPARGGSKGIPHKNIIELCGKPLIWYTIKAATSSRHIDYTMVSTDDDVIARVARDCGARVPFMRPGELANDNAKTINVVLHAIRSLEEMGHTFDVLVLLQPTSPLRTVEDVDEAIATYFDNGCKALASVNVVDDSPILIRPISGGMLKPIIDVTSTCRRQDMPCYYKVNGGIYINSVDELNEDTSFNDNSIPFILQDSHSVDVDELSDLWLAKYYLEKLRMQC